MKTYGLTIITPHGKIFDHQVTSLIAPGLYGSFGIWANHSAMVCTLRKGVLQIKSEGEEHFYAIDSGVLEVDPQSQVLVLIDNAFLANTLEEAKSRLAEFEIALGPHGRS